MTNSTTASRVNNTRPQTTRARSYTTYSSAIQARGSRQSPRPSQTHAQPSLSASSSTPQSGTNHATQVTQYSCTACNPNIIFVSDIELLEHVRNAHSAGGHIHLSTTQINSMGLQRCLKCFHVHLLGATHPTTCVPSEAPAFASLRNDLNATIAAGSLIKVRFGQLPFVVNTSWAEVFGRAMSTFDSVPKIPALNTLIVEVFMLVSSQATSTTLPSQERENALKLLFMLPFLLFQQEHGKHAASFTAQVSQRLRWFMANKFDELVSRATATSLAFQEYCNSMPKSPSPMGPKIKRVTSLVASGDVGKATDLLLSTSNMLDSRDAETHAKVQQLFPPRIHSDISPQPNTSTLPATSTIQANNAPTQNNGTTGRTLVTTSPDFDIQSYMVDQQVAPLDFDGTSDSTIITAQDVQTALTRSHKAAAGPTGWHISFIKTIGASVAGRQRIADLLNLLMSSQCPQGAIDALHLAKLTVLSKDSGGVRPITTRDSWLRLLSKVIVCKEQIHAGEALAPLQAGVGLPGGVEFVVHTVRHLLHANPTWCAIAIDCKNAYGCISRDKICQSLNNSRLCLSYFKRYCDSPIVVRASGTTTLTMAEGVAQGDPLSPLFFSLALQDTLQITQQTMNNLGAGRTFAYLDDVVLVGPPSSLSQAFSVFKHKCSSVGLSVNISKTQVLTLRTDLDPMPEDIAQLTATHTLSTPKHVIRLLGTPVGLPQLESTEAANMIREITFGRLAEVSDKQTRLIILRQCIAQSISHLLRTMLPESSLLASQHHDAFVYHALASIIEMPSLPMPSRIEASFPPSLGGLGLPLLEQQRYISYLASSAAVIQTWRNYVSDDDTMLSSWLNDNTTSPIPQQLAQSLAAANIIVAASHGNPHQDPQHPAIDTTMPRSLDAVLNFTQVRGLQHKLSHLQHTTQCEHYRHNFLVGQHDRAQYLSKTGPGAAAYLQAIPSDPSLKLNNLQFVTCLRMWLRLPVLPLFGCPRNLPCHCNRFDSTTSSHVRCDELHIFNCAGENARSQRHHDMVAAFQQMYQSVMLKADLEPMATTADTSRARHDLSLHDGRGTCLKLDITVRSPLAHATIAQAAVHPLHAACKGTQEKISKYAHLLSGNEKFIPIAIESFGALHEYVQQQISFASLRVNHLPPATATYAAPTFQAYWTQRLSCTLWRANANLASLIVKRTMANNPSLVSVDISSF
jgi:hypothetical protein